MTAESPVHIRLPQRATAVAGQDPQPGVIAPAAVSDPRTASQDPAAAAIIIPAAKAAP